MAAPQRQSSPSISPSSRRRCSTAAAEDFTVYQLQHLTDWDIFEQSRQGVTARQVDQLTQILDVSLKEMAAILQISERTLHRSRSKDHFKQQASERLLFLQNVTAHGLSVFDDRRSVFARWLRYPLGELKGQAPLSLLTSMIGFSLVDDVLTRIDYGIYC